MTRSIIRVQAEPFDVAAEGEALVADQPSLGALVSFIGFCRDEGGRLAALELEHYPGMAESEMTRIADEAAARWPVGGLTLIHRYGVLKPGEAIVAVLAAGAHRREAFAAAEFIMDFLKTSAPFWKREHLIDGSTGPWVEARDTDDAAAERWTSQAAS